jgi:hypothetical protein
VDRSHVVWAREMREDQNSKLFAYFRDRKIWLLEPDASPPRLSPYQIGTPSSIALLKEENR